MHWDDLRFFLAVARSGQLARAATALEVDATTAGRRIRRLERNLEQILFEKSRDGLILTEAGEQLLRRVEEMDRAAASIDEAPGHRQASGRVRVSVSEGFGTWFVAHHLPEFIGEFPGVTVDLVASSGFLSPGRRETDVAVLLARPRTGPLIATKLADYALRLYASRRYLARQPVPPRHRADLADHPLIGYIPDLLYAPELRYLEEIDPSLSASVRSSSINAQYRLAAAGAGIAPLPCFIGDADKDLVRVVEEVRIIRSFWLVAHEDNRRLARVGAFIDWLTKTVRRRRARLLGL